MRLLIFEGIATSGKSTVIQLLTELLPDNLNVKVADEEETHVPIMEEREETHLEFFKKLITQLTSEEPDILILDRFYMTQAYRAKCDLSPYKELEELLLQFNPTTIFLKVDEEAIPARINKATEHRNPEWAEYVKARGQEKEMADYYVKQQQSQLNLLKASNLPYKIINTTDSNFDEAAQDIINLFK